MLPILNFMATIPLNLINIIFNMEEKYAATKYYITNIKQFILLDGVEKYLNYGEFAIIRP